MSVEGLEASVFFVKYTIGCGHEWIKIWVNMQSKRVLAPDGAVQL